MPLQDVYTAQLIIMQNNKQNGWLWTENMCIEVTQWP